jgi:hypothetical protein
MRFVHNLTFTTTNSSEAEFSRCSFRTVPVFVTVNTDSIVHTHVVDIFTITYLLLINDCHQTE